MPHLVFIWLVSLSPSWQPRMKHPLPIWSRTHSCVRTKKPFSKEEGNRIGWSMLSIHYDVTQRPWPQHNFLLFVLPSLQPNITTINKQHFPPLAVVMHLCFHSPLLFFSLLAPLCPSTPHEIDSRLSRTFCSKMGMAHMKDKGRRMGSYL